jgi:hypothetical protein
MPSRFLCNGVKREGVKASPDLASELFYYVPLHKIRYGIGIKGITPIHAYSAHKKLKLWPLIRM